MKPRISELSQLRNLGERSEAWLNEIGIYSRDELEELGSVEIYRMLKQRGRPVTLNLVWAIEGALADIDWRQIPASLRSELRRAVMKI